MGTKPQKRTFATHFYDECQRLNQLKQHKLREEGARDDYHTRAVQKRQMDDWQRAEQLAQERRQRAVQIAKENMMLAEMKRQNEQAARVTACQTETAQVRNQFYALQSDMLR